MILQPLIESVNNKTIQFITFRPHGSPFAVLDRNVKVTGPDSVLQLIQAADITLLPSLIDLLKDSKRAWAAEIILKSLTSGDGKIIESFENDSKKWWEIIGINAYQNWNDWYLKNKNNIEWNKTKKIFEIKQLND